MLYTGFVTSPDRPGQLDEILRAVWLVIAERGMDQVSMRTVATAAGVSVGRIQYRFRTKSDLLHASLEAMLTAAVDEHIAATAEAEPLDVLWHLLTRPIPRGETAQIEVSILSQYASAGIIQPGLAQLLNEAEVAAEGAATRQVRLLAPHLGDPRSVARSLIATADGLSLRVLLGGLSPPAAEEALRGALARAVG